MVDIQEWNPENLDLTTCDREPIHIPGSVQPYGVLLVLQGDTLTIVRCSDNTEAVLGVPPQKLLQNALDTITGRATAEKIAEAFANPTKLVELNPIYIGKDYYGIAHHSPDGQMVFEIEPAQAEAFTSMEFYHNIQRAVRRLKSAPDIPALCQAATQEIRRLNGFDRVMVYQFDPHWNGAVLAEDKIDALEPYLGLHYPASDIPKQARALYRLNPLRLIYANDYTPAQMLSIEDDPAPLDMSFAQLRSVSPIHMEYLQNMGVSASMSISVLKDGELWGLIACHHTTPRIVSFDVRAACELLTQVFAIQIAERTNALLQEKQARANSIMNQLVESMAQQEDEGGFVSGLVDYEPNLLHLVEADGAAIYFSGECYAMGTVPSDEDIASLTEWLQNDVTANIYTTDSLARENPDFTHMRDVASGVLAICISRVQGDYIFWFRPEQQKTVEWGGDPTKRAAEGDTGRIHPRKSFASWKEVVALESVEWEKWEVQIVTRLRNIIVDTVLRLAGELRLRANILAKLNSELTRSNNELDSFAYMASHDLKEPLRGIHNYATFLLEDYQEILPEEGTDKLKTLMRLSERMEELVNSLLEFSRMGRIELKMTPTDFNEILQESLSILKHRIDETGTSVTIDNPLPTLPCDAIHMIEVFNNLIVNAIKYNDKADKRIHIGSTDTTFYVRDNGIGIPQKHYETIFNIFKRLHGRKHYGDGTGAGLTIVKKIIERHNGRIWLESTEGEGTTFYFTLNETV